MHLTTGFYRQTGVRRLSWSVSAEVTTHSLFPAETSLGEVECRLGLIAVQSESTQDAWFDILMADLLSFQALAAQFSWFTLWKRLPQYDHLVIIKGCYRRSLTEDLIDYSSDGC